MIDPFASIAKLRDGLTKKQFSSVELTQEYLTRLQTIGRRHRAVAELMRDRALDEAAAADRRIAAGESTPVLGIPYGAKDLLAAKGAPTRWGSPGHKEQRFDFDATVIAKLKAAGGVLAAKLSMIELAGGGNYDVPWASADGACLAAHDATRWAGGSSSGSGAVASLGCAGFTLGSETSGSITCPCAFNGATGLRPTYGRVSRFGAMALCWTLDKIGPICRSVEDCEAVLKVISGHDAKDPSSVSAALDLAAPGKIRIGLLKEEFAENDAPVCQKAYEEAIAVFKKRGYEIVDVAYPDLPYGLAVGIIVDAEGASAHENFIRSERLTDLADVNQVAGFAAGLEVKAVDYLWAMRMRVEAAEKCSALWEKCDCIFTPVFYHRAPPADRPFSEAWRNMGGDGGPANLLGWPTVAFPIGLEEGSPIGGQVISPAFGENVIISVAKAYQLLTAHHRVRPSESQPNLGKVV
ncbi:MAG: amidase [Armatimonadota bacterium]|nr:amidase [Armatimonadota bacterium]